MNYRGTHTRNQKTLEEYIIVHKTDIYLKKIVKAIFICDDALERREKRKKGQAFNTYLPYPFYQQLHLYFLSIQEEDFFEDIMSM